MDLRNVINWEIPEGVVVKVMDSNGVVIWDKGNNEPDLPDLPTPLANEIYYTSTDGNIVELSSYYSGVQPISNTYENGIGKMVFEKDLTEIGYRAFRNSNLISVTIPKGVTSIKQQAFIYCTGLTSVTIPDSVTSIGLSAFYGCTSLTSVTIPDSVTFIDQQVFSGCTSLTSIIIPSSVSKIEINLFANCTSLKTVTINEGVEYIETDAFRNCSSLESINIPKSIKDIGISPFPYNMQITSNSERFVVENDCLIDIENKRLINGLISNENYIYQIPNNVTYIDLYAFMGCTCLKIIIPEGVTSIEEYAFRDSDFQSIVIPSSIIKIGIESFEDCKTLQYITCKKMQAITLNNNAFNHVGENVEGEKILYVPQNSKGYESWLSQLKGFELQYIKE